MIILVAGFKGYIGKYLCESFRRKNIEALGIFRDKGKFKVIWLESGEQLATGTFVQISQTLTSQSIKVHSIVNLAADTSKDSSYEAVQKLCEANVTFNALLARLAVDLNVTRFIYTSTYSVSMDGQSYSPQTLYAATKYAGGNLLNYFARFKKLNIVKLYFYDIYGPLHHKNRLLPILIEALITGQSVRLSPGEQETSPLFVYDACDAILHSLFQLQEENLCDYSVMGPEKFQVKEIPNIVSKALGISWKVNQLLADKDYRSNEIMSLAPLYPNIPDWKPRYTLEAGLSEMSKHYNLKRG